MDWLSTKEAAEIIGITMNGVKQAGCRGKLKYILKGNTRLYKLQDVEHYRDNRKVGPPFKKKKGKKS